MNQTGLSQAVLEQAQQRRGTLHALADFDPATCALLVIDMQNFFFDMMPDALTLVPAISRLARSLRLGGGQVAWVSTTLAAQDRDSWSVFFDRLLTQNLRDAHLDSLARDHDGWQLCAGLQPQDEDWRIDKSRFSALIADASDLHTRLRERGVDTLLIAGAGTNVGCESTGRDAMMLNFATIIVSDACVGTDTEAHLATLANFQTIFGDVLSVDGILAGIDQTVQVDSATLRNI